jgi:hypothetical protein
VSLALQAWFAQACPILPVISFDVTLTAASSATMTIRAACSIACSRLSHGFWFTARGLSACTHRHRQQAVSSAACSGVTCRPCVPRDDNYLTVGLRM